jgi:hypothetical protein
MERPKPRWKPNPRYRALNPLAISLALLAALMLFRCALEARL